MATKVNGEFYAKNGDTAVKVGGVVSISELALTRNTVDDNDLDNTTDGYSHVKGGLRDAGEISVILRFKKGDAGQNLLKADFDQDEDKGYEIRYPDADKTQFEITGLVTGISTAMPAADGVHIDRTYTIKLNGAPVEGTWS
ncbi:phage tail tube protein [Endozoicomonas lisbonensis]|uniref:Lambda phage tail tube protein N-terminal domain-containing protein n=1 Tax=Endozoicomonas lisbonensis TaxID=3120522 RepID=A0ABV2SFH4_9GAMM